MSTVYYFYSVSSTDINGSEVGSSLQVSQSPNKRTNTETESKESFTRYPRSQKLYLTACFINVPESELLLIYLWGLVLSFLYYKVCGVEFVYTCLSLFLNFKAGVI